jgi:hypothetical protein
MMTKSTTAKAEKQLAPLIASLLVDNQPILDRLTVLGDFKNPDKNSLKISRHNDYLDIVNAPFPYNYRIRTASDLHIQIANTDSQVQNVRIEYNPAKLDPDGTLLPLILPMLKNKRFSRIDYAIDYKEDLSEFNFSTTRSRKRVKFFSPADKLETLYLGTRNSSDFYRIYNKAVEQDQEGTLWRIEQQFNLDKNTEFWMLRPFADLIAWKPSDLTGSYIDDLVLADLNSNPENWARLTDFLRRKYKRMITQPERVSQFEIHPSEQFLAGYQPLADYLTKILE